MKNDQSPAPLLAPEKGKNPESELLWWKKMLSACQGGLGRGGWGGHSAKLISFQAASSRCPLPFQRPMFVGFVAMDGATISWFPHVKREP